MAVQAELPLFAPVDDASMPPVPIRMVNEYVYCPRLAWLMWVDKEWSETADTADGRRIHQRVDRAAGGAKLLAPGTRDTLGAPSATEETSATQAGKGESRPEEQAQFRTTALTLSSDRLGVIGRLDVVDGDGKVVVPVDYKRGKRPHVSKGAYQPERVQLALQAMLLEEYGYSVPEAAIWYAESRERVAVELDDQLRADALRAISELRLAAAGSRAPPPLVDSPKCPRCALLAICMPDEVNFLKRARPVRPFAPSDDPALPVHVQTPGARVRKSGESLVISTDETKVEVPFIHVSELVIHGPVSLTTPALGGLLSAGIPVGWHTSGGWFLGHARPLSLASVDIRLNQFRAIADPLASRRIAAGIVAAKIRNQRTLLRRNWKHGSPETREASLRRMKRLSEAAARAPSAEALLGLEGEAAGAYFALFDSMLAKSSLPTFRFDRRNRRPPSDPINALLSYAYALCTRSVSAALAKVGFDPSAGFYHRPRHGRPSLALDMMEPFRPILADSTVITVVNNGEVAPSDFVYHGPSCALKPAARKQLIAAWERRLEQEAVHPVFGNRLTARRTLEVQCRLLARFLAGEIEAMPHYMPR